MKPQNESNFVIEVTQEVMDELNRLYRLVDESPVEELHYSPYWKEVKTSARTLPIEREDAIE